jgi:hypothetical protein
MFRKSISTLIMFFVISQIAFAQDNDFSRMSEQTLKEEYLTDLSNKEEEQIRIEVQAIVKSAFIGAVCGGIAGYIAIPKENENR